MNVDTLAAERYTSALFEVTREGHATQEFEDELLALSSALSSSPDAEKYFKSPARNQDKRRLLEKIFPPASSKTRKVLLDFFTLLLEKNRFPLVHEIAVIYKRKADTSQGESPVLIESAVALDAAQEKAIVAGLEKMTGTKVAVTKKVDPSLIGGVRVMIKNRVLDGSVKNKIERFNVELKQTRLI